MKRSFVLGGFGRDVGSDKGTGFLSMLGVVQRRQLRKQAGRSRIVGGPRSCVFLAKPELQHAADAVAFRVSTVGLEISHFTILFKREMTKTMIDI